jgi:hypothetical protein
MTMTTFVVLLDVLLGVVLLTTLGLAIYVVRRRMREYHHYRSLVRRFDREAEEPADDHERDKD